ncbi:MAG: DUF1735 and LamG domain-containing protein [Mediterranea sp.]|jgi:hypothetical protein|nr:DUF1735 and LamG domain-containing protein [Mediterranea sp.]
MKQKNILFTLLALLALVTGCDRVDEKDTNFDNQVFINEARIQNVSKILLKPYDVNLTSYLQTAIATREDKNITVTYKVDPTLVARYNELYKKKAEMLPEEFYELPDVHDTIYAGKVTSTKKIEIDFKALDQFPRMEQKTYVLPITLATTSALSILSSSQTMFFVVREGPPVVRAANIKGTALVLSDYSKSSLKDMKQITMETLMRPQSWPVSDSQISSIMGIEGTYLWRISDAGIPNNQIQLARSGGLGGNWAPVGGTLELGIWQHVAITQDFTTGEEKLYINGELIQKDKGGTESLTLATEKFGIGKSFEDGRPFDGDVCEMRIWSKVRTQKEIQASIYQVAEDAPGLEAYWKFDEGAGNDIKDNAKHEDASVNNNLKLFVKNGTPYPNITWINVELGGEDE